MDIHNQKIKIVIWDLDDTFWKGTLSEGDVYPIAKNIELVKHLTDIGIINSISSKNDYEPVKAKLTELGVWDYFVFPHINWDPKGPQIRHLLDECSLRAQNAVFIDDNPQNRNEAAYYNEGLTVFSPESIDTLFEVTGKPDPAHERLNQYKLLEVKREDSLKYHSNDAFLRASNIQVVMKNDCDAHFDRLLDLINRSNQLNYTKVRLTAEALQALLQDKEAETGYVEVYDNYGEYGIVGFYSIRDHVAEHFLFSCRTIGMGIEQFVYAQLGYPALQIIGEVRNGVTADFCPDWITFGKVTETASQLPDNAKKPHILITGGCDLEQLAAYLKNASCSVDYKFNVRDIRHDHTVFMVGAKTYSKACIDEMIQKVPFIGRATFDTAMYQEKYSVVVISLLMDYTQAVFEKNDEPGVYIAYGDYNMPVTEDFCPESLSQKEYAYLMEHYHLIGRIPDELFLNNLESIRQMLPASTSLVLINGCEVPFEHKWEKDRYIMHRHYNALVDSFISSHANTYLLDMRKIVTNADGLANNIRHYSRAAYYEMASELSQLINTIFKSDLLQSKETAGGFFWQVKNKSKKLIDLLRR